MKDDFDDMLKGMLNLEKDYIPDDGFTNRVLGKLPASAPRPLLRYAILLAFTAVAAGIVLFISPGYTAVTNAVVESTTALARFQMPSFVSIAVVGIFIWGALVPLRSALRRPF
jgi:hypothetical protein